MRRLNKAEIELMVNRFLWMEDDEFERIYKDPRTTKGDKWIMGIIQKGLITGEWGGFEWIATRLVGKVESEIVIKQKIVAEIESLTDAELIEMAQTKLLEAKKE